MENQCIRKNPRYVAIKPKIKDDHCQCNRIELPCIGLPKFVGKFPFLLKIYQIYFQNKNFLAKLWNKTKKNCVKLSGFF